MAIICITCDTYNTLYTCTSVDLQCLPVPGNNFYSAYSTIIIKLYNNRIY